MKKFLLIAIVIIGLAIATYRYLNQDTSPMVKVVHADRGDVVASVTNTRAGTVDTCRRAGLTPATGGPIVKLHVADGDAVEQGQLLLELWNEDLKAQVVVAEREAVATRSREQEVCVASRVARREANRLVTLFERKLTSADAKEHAVGEADTRAAACKAARDATLVGESRVDLAKAALERTLLSAPFSGVVAEINGELGEYVTPSPVGVATPPTIDLIDNTCLYISAPIDEVDAPAVRSDMRAWITLDAFPTRRFAGHVSRVAPYVLAVEKQSRTVEVEAIIDDPDQGLLLPGYSADVEVLLDRRDDVLRIPTAIIREGPSLLVRLADGVLEERAITTGLANWEYTEVLSGISAQDQVVSSINREGVKAGVYVRVEE